MPSPVLPVSAPRFPHMVLSACLMVLTACAGGGGTFAAIAPKDIGPGGSSGTSSGTSSGSTTGSTSDSTAADTTGSTTGTSTGSATGSIAGLISGATANSASGATDGSASGTTDSSSSTTLAPTVRDFGSTYSTLKASADGFWSKYKSTASTTAAQMPTAGRAVFQGVVTISDSATGPEQVIATADRAGRAEVVVNFGASAFSGRLYGFTNQDAAVSTTGELALTGLVIDANIVGSASGSLTDSGYGKSEQLNVNTTVLGGFAGSGAEAVRILGTGPISGPVSGTRMNSLYIIADR